MRAAIAGAGIGGLTAAIALRRAAIDATVYERAPDPSRVQLGGGIHVWHNGMRGLQHLGLDEAVTALGGRGAVVDRAEFTTSSGWPLAAWSVQEVGQELEAPTVGVRRPDLHAALLGALDDGVVRFGVPCTGFQQDGGGVTLRLADGQQERVDVLVGADGLKSTVRAQLHGEQEPRFAGYASWQALATVGTDVVPIGLFRVLWGRGARFLFYRVSSDTVYWEGIFATGPGGKDPEGGRKAAVQARFGGWNEPVAAIVEATPEEEISRADIYDRPPIRRWGDGRVTLLGDAAHPMTNALGQGANQAIEDSVVLARSLGSAADPAAGLRAYERARKARAHRFARISWTLAQLSEWQRPWACHMRDAGLKMAFSTVLLRKQRQDMAYSF